MNRTSVAELYSGSDLRAALGSVLWVLTAEPGHRLVLLVLLHPPLTLSLLTLMKMMELHVRNRTTLRKTPDQNHRSDLILL